MAYTDIFDQRNNDYGNTIKTSRSNSMKQKITSTFKNSPSYYPITVNTPSSPYISTPLDAQIVDDPTKTKEVKQITLIPNQTLNYGDVISWLGDYWLTTTVDYMGGMYYRGSMQKCYSSLKWLDENGAIKEAYFTKKLDPSNLGLNFGSVVPEDKEKRFLFIQNNSDTAKIQKSKRFILDERAWRVVSVDRVNNTGMIYLELTEHDVGANDNLSLKIADYVGNVANYSIHILNGGNVSIQANKTLQVSVEVKNNGNIATVPVTYISDTPSVATVNSSGLITTVGNGNATISAYVTSNPSVVDVLPITVQLSTTPNYTVEIVGDTYISKTTSKTYNILIKNNGVIDNSRTVTWTLTGDDGISATSLASITFQSNTQVTIKGVTVGFVKLKSTIQGSSSNDVIRIQIVKLI